MVSYTTSGGKDGGASDLVPSRKKRSSHRVSSVGTGSRCEELSPGTGVVWCETVRFSEEGRLRSPVRGRNDEQGTRRFGRTRGQEKEGSRSVWCTRGPPGQGPDTAVTVRDGGPVLGLHVDGGPGKEQVGSVFKSFRCRSKDGYVGQEDTGHPRGDRGVNGFGRRVVGVVGEEGTVTSSVS